MAEAMMKRNTKIHETKVDRIFNVVVYVLIALLLLMFIYPLWFVLMASFSDPQYVNAGALLIYPRGFTTMGYKMVFSDDRIWTGYLNTIFYAGVGTVLATMVQVMAGYALSRKDLPGRSIFMLLFVFTMYCSGGLIPFYLVVKALNLVNTRLILIILGSVSVYNMILIRTFFSSSIPDEMREAAFIDGCSNTRFFVQFALPLSKAIIAVIAL